MSYRTQNILAGLALVALVLINTTLGV